MKTLHVAYSFPPDPPGGTEVYVDALCRQLMRVGVEAVVVAPGPRDERYEMNGLTVRRVALQTSRWTLDDLYGDGDRQYAESFARVLDEERPDLVHQHAVTTACSLEGLRQAKKKQLPVVLTYHTPTFTCQRGTLLEWGTTVCDGRLEVSRCAACTLQGLGVPRALSSTLARVPVRVGDSLARRGLAGGPWTALRMSSLIRKRHESVLNLFAIADKIVVLSPWTEALLRTNGVRAEKISPSSHGIVHSDRGHERSRVPGSGRLTVAHLGRLDPVKGTRLLIEAIRSIPKASLDLDVFGIVQDQEGNDLLAQLRTLADGDARIRFLPRLDHDDVIDRLRTYDLVAVPSQWMETGPLVVLEAFAAGVPVVGSALGGIEDKVRDGIDGLLVRPHHSRQAWADALMGCATDGHTVAQLRNGVRKPRSMDEVAAEMHALYVELTAITTAREKHERAFASI